MKKNFLFPLFLLIILVLFTKKLFFFEKKNNFTVAIIQCASNPSLDLLRDSAILNIKKKLNKEVNFIIKNAGASLLQANTICSQLHKNQEIDLFFTIGSGPTQAISYLEKKRPIIFAGVSNPKHIGLNEGHNVSGTIDSISEENIFRMITELLPYVKKIGILRTTGELNEKECLKFKNMCQKKNIICKDFTVLTESEVIAQTQEACQKVDAVFVPTDSIVASAISFVIQETKAKKIPLFLAFNEPVALGAFAACGVDYSKNGEVIAKIITSILEKNKTVDQIKFEMASTKEIYVNKKTAEYLDISISQNTNKEIEFIFVN